MKVKSAVILAAAVLIIASLSFGDGQPIHYSFGNYVEIYPYQGQHYASVQIDEGPTDCDVEAWLNWWNYGSQPDDNELAKGYIDGNICVIAVREYNVSGSSSGQEYTTASNVNLSGAPDAHVFHGMYAGTSNFFFYRIKYTVGAEGTYSDPDND